MSAPPPNPATPIDENLAYGEMPGPAPEGTERGLVGDTYRKIRKSEGVGAFFGKLSDAVGKVNDKLEGRLSPKRPGGAQFTPTSSSQAGIHRFESFAAPCEGNDVKWYVDGAGYFWAVSIALERARESIWILDWWLSPELYLRRPPSKNEQYRLDRMLQAAAQRGVKINVIVYKEVTQALTRKYLTPALPDYLHSLLHPGVDALSSVVTRLGLAATFAALETVERESPLIEPPLPVSSEHTKHALEALHPNISVFRHPDHLPDAKVFQSNLLSGLKSNTISASTAAKLTGDALRALYGVSEDVILYWAHHEKLCLVDGITAFMGGLDLCYGRWDLHHHPIADAHPEDLEGILWPGQDYNNARIMDFADVKNWEQNKLDRKESSRMGWQDISISLHGPVVDDLRAHFIGRWNFIYSEKYNVRKDVRYNRIGPDGQMQQSQQPGQQPASQPGYSPPAQGAPQQASQPYQSGQQAQSAPQQQEYFPPPPGTSSQQSFPPPPGAPSQQTFPPPPGVSSQQQSFAPPPTSSSQQTLPAAGASSQQSFPPPPPGPPPSDNSQSYTYHPENYSKTQPQYQAYHPSPSMDSGSAPPGTTSAQQPQQQPQVPYFPPPPSSYREPGASERGLNPSHHEHHQHLERLEREVEREGEHLADRLEQRLHISGHQHSYSGSRNRPAGRMACQIVRSATKWSNGTPTEHSVQNAYASIIERSTHFVYIENQFFITATGTKQRPVQNTIGRAIVDRILRAARNGEKYKVIVVMPAIPAFAGDLKDDSSLGTRAIMEFQYFSINRGDHSIMEEIANAGFDPTQYIRFYNLRNYDRINDGSAMREIEQQSGIDYEIARREHDDIVDPVGYRAQGGAGKSGDSYEHEHYLKYRKTLDSMDSVPGSTRGLWDSVAACYMKDGPDIRTLAWQDGDKKEVECFVSEELYIHSKVLIADDRIVICGSANLNDRSQLGTHDSEIACVIEDMEEIESAMNRNPWRATKFAATLRRFLTRKHLGLVKPQHADRPDANFQPVGVPNDYDYGSPEDRLVHDPLADQFLNFWNQRANTNTNAFGRLFHPVPHDSVRTWADYGTFFEAFFKKADKEAEGKEHGLKPAKYEWGHVVTENFSGVQEVKDVLSTIKGTLVEMPLLFLDKEDIAKEGLSLNILTEEIYT